MSKIRICCAPISEVWNGDGLRADDIQFIESVSSDKRRRELASWRSVLRAMGRAERVEYHESGAPYLVDSEIYISVSHSRTMVAVAVSEECCAVDIEQVGRDFRKVERRLLTHGERVLVEERRGEVENILAIIWSSKECLYKFHSQRTLEMLSDIEVVSIDSERGLVIADVAGVRQAPLHYIYIGDNILVASGEIVFE